MCHNRNLLVLTDMVRDLYKGRVKHYVFKDVKSINKLASEKRKCNMFQKNQ